MTSGILIFSRAKEIQASIKVWSDAYFSELGLDVFNAYKNNSSSELIKNLTNDRNCTRINIDWSDVIRHKNEPALDFTEYTYILDLKKDTLKVYYYGSLLLSFKRDESELCQYIFSHDDELYKALTFDNKTWSHKKDWAAELKKLRSESRSLEEIKRMVETYQEPRFTISGIDEMDKTRCWPNSDICRFKVGHFYPEPFEFEFFLSHNIGSTSRVSFHFQLPWIRTPIGPTSFSSRSSAQEWLAAFVKEHQQEFSVCSKFFQCYEEFAKKRSSIIKQQQELPKERVIAQIDLLRKEYLVELDDLKEKHSMVPLQGLMSIENMRKEIQIGCFNAIKNICGS